MAITIERNQKIQNLQIIDKIYMYILCDCVCVCVIAQIQMLKLPKCQKKIYN